MRVRISYQIEKQLSVEFKNLSQNQDDEESLSPSQHKEKLDCLCDWDLFILFRLSSIQGTALDSVQRENENRTY